MHVIDKYSEVFGDSCNIFCYGLESCRESQLQTFLCPSILICHSIQNQAQHISIALDDQSSATSSSFRKIDYLSYSRAYPFQILFFRIQAASQNIQISAAFRFQKYQRAQIISRRFLYHSQRISLNFKRTLRSLFGIYYKKRQKVGENNFVALLFLAISPSFGKARSKEDPTKHSGNDLPSQTQRSGAGRSILPQIYSRDIMLTRQEGKMIKQELGECESMQSNQSVEFQYLTAKNYEELIRSHEQAKTFISELGEARRTPVNDSLLAYVKEMRFSLKSGDSIMELMESRLSKMIKNNKIKKNWSEEDLHILVWFLSKYMGKNGIQSHEAMTKADWERLSALIPGSTARSCMFKFVSLKKFKLAQHKWSKEEDSLMHKIITEIGTKSWKAISERLYEESIKKKIYRTAKQCREHWSCYLDPRIKKGPWDQDEDKKLLQIVLESQCQKKWSIIKQQFEGRTENALKNRYNLLLEKQKKITPMDKEADIINEILKEDKDQTSEQQEPSEKEKPHKNVIAIPEPIFRGGEERRSNEIFNPSYIILFNNAGDGKLPSLPLNTWFFQM